jgi:MFS family permease
VRREAAEDRRRRLLAYGTGFVYVFGLGTVLAFLPAYGSDRGLTAPGVGLLLGSYWIARLIGSLGAGRLSDRAGRRAVLVPAMLVGGVSAFLVAVPLGHPALFVGTIGLGLAAGASAPTCVALIADHVSPGARGLAMGLFEGACGLSIIVAGLIGGEVAEALGPQVPYVLVGVMALGWTAVVERTLRGGA